MGKKVKDLWKEKNKKLLIENKIDFVEIEPWHYQLATKKGIINFYPTTNKWFTLDFKHKGLGFNSLKDYLDE